MYIFLFGDNCIEAEEALRWCTEIILLSIVTLSVLIQFITLHRWWGPSCRQCTPTVYWGLWGEQGHLYEPLAVPEDVELWQRHVGGHLDRVVAAVPRVLQVGHRVAETLWQGRVKNILLLRHWRTLFTYFHGAHLDVEGEVGEVHRACSL